MSMSKGMTGNEKWMEWVRWNLCDPCIYNTELGWGKDKAVPPLLRQARGFPLEPGGRGGHEL
jgi:hypothetical protein